MEEQYKKPIFDPWEVFQPEPAVLRQAIKQMKEECHAIIQKQNLLKQEDFYFEDSDSAQTDIRRHKFLCWKIKDYEKRLKAHKQSGSYVIASNQEGRITQVDIDRAKQSPILDLFTGKIKRYGKRATVHCPLHSEKTPSFVIYLDQNSWHCYGCNEGGDVIALIMKMNKLSFIEAVRKLI